MSAGQNALYQANGSASGFSSGVEAGGAGGVGAMAGVIGASEGVGAFFEQQALEESLHQLEREKEELIDENSEQAAALASLLE